MYKVLAVGIFTVFISGCENPFSSGRTRHTFVDFSRYQTVLQHGNPFGIVSLSMQGEPVGFSHPDLPLGDWEWFWYDADGKTNERKHFKLLDTKWSDPRIETDAELFYEKSAILIRDWPDPKIEIDAATTELFYEKKNVLLPGLDLGVTYRFGRVDTFCVSYSITNYTGELLPQPYMMIGFPGFTDHESVSAVSIGSEKRVPIYPFSSFSQEAALAGRKEYSLLHEDFDDTTGSRLTATVTVLSSAGSYHTLQVTLLSNNHIARVSADHIIKARYMTSHLYILLDDLRSNDNYTVDVSYKMISTKE